MSWETHNFRDLPYSELEAHQQRFAELVKADPDHAYLVLAEPKPTFTAGRSAKMEELLWSPEELEKRGVSIERTTRGGQWTFHGPGQIVGYPIVQLRSLGYSSRAVSRFLKELAGAIKTVLAKSGIETDLGCPFGLYKEGAKLVSFGISVSQGVVTHGFALNVRPVAPFFSGIHPCGVARQPVTSLEELGLSTDWQVIATQLETQIKKVLELRAYSL